MMKAPLLFGVVLAISGCKKSDPAPTPTTTAPADPGAALEEGSGGSAETARALAQYEQARANAQPEPALAQQLDSKVVGKPAPDFALPDLAGKEVKLSSFKGKVIVLEWFNPGCPYVVKSHTVGSLVDTAKRHAGQGVVWLAINSGAAGKQGHDPAANTKAAKSWAMEHPILRDESGAVGKAYGATNTPNMFVIDPAGVVVYGGAIDNSPDGERQSPQGGPLVNHVDAALEDLAAGRPVRTAVTKPYGCGVKYGS